MQDRIHFEVGVDEGVEAQFKSRFEGGAVGADVERDGVDVGHLLVKISNF